MSTHNYARYSHFFYLMYLRRQTEEEIFKVHVIDFIKAAFMLQYTINVAVTLLTLEVKGNNFLTL